MTRRLFFELLGLGGAAIATLGATACWVSQNTFVAILAYVGVGLQAFQSIVDMLAGNGVINIGTGSAIDAVINLVKVGFADLQTAVNNYQNAPADQKATLLGEVSTALATLEQSLQKFWNDLQLPDAQLAALVEGLLGIILSTLQAFATQLPAPQMKMKLGLKKTVATTPKKRTAKQFKADFNALLAAKGQTKYEVR